MTFFSFLHILYLSQAAPNIIYNQRLINYTKDHDASNSTIICPEAHNCEITNKIHQSHIYCPSFHKCTIICNNKGCIETRIHATNSSHLHIKPGNNSSNMSIYCPIDGICAFEGNHSLHNTHIYTLNGFRDIYIKGELTLNASHIYCGPTSTEQHCISNTQGTTCSDGDIMCNIDGYNAIDVDKTISIYFNTENRTQIISYIAVGAWLFMPILIIIIALIYHQTQTGSDSPAYFSVFKSFIKLADFYTDIIFCVFLLKQNSNLYIAALIFTFIPHIISIIICMLYIHKWSHHIYKIAYIKRYDSFMITATVLMGFVPVIQMLTSKLLYASRLTLQICLREKIQIQRFNFMNHNLLQDIPLIIIQVLTAFDAQYKIDNIPINITMIAFIFSSLSILIGSIAFFSKCRYIRYHTTHIMTYEIDIKSDRINNRHYYCHRLLAACLCQCLETDDGQIETVSVIPIVDGISSRVEIRYNLPYEIDVVDAVFKEIINVESDRFCAFQKALCNKLHMRECSDLDVMISRLDLDGLEGNITKLKGRNTLYIPLKLCNTNGTNSTDIRAEIEAMRLSGEIIGDIDVIEEIHEEVPLKQQSLLLETMKHARVNNNVNDLNQENSMESIEIIEEKSMKIEDMNIVEYEKTNETESKTQSAIQNGWILNNINTDNENDDDYNIECMATNYELEILSQLQCES